MKEVDIGGERARELYRKALDEGYGTAGFGLRVIMNDSVVPQINQEDLTQEQKQDYLGRVEDNFERWLKNSPSDSNVEFEEDEVDRLLEDTDYQFNARGRITGSTVPREYAFRAVYNP